MTKLSSERPLCSCCPIYFAAAAKVRNPPIVPIAAIAIFLLQSLNFRLNHQFSVALVGLLS